MLLKVGYKCSLSLLLHNPKRFMTVDLKEGGLERGRVRAEDNGLKILGVIRLEKARGM